MEVELSSLIRRVADGASLAVPSENTGVSMAATRELVRRWAYLRAARLPKVRTQAGRLLAKRH